MEDMEDVDRIQLYNCICRYSLGNDVSPTGIVAIIRKRIKNEIDGYKEKYEKVIERNRQNGLKGGRKPQVQPTKKPKEPSGLSGNPKNPNEPERDNHINKLIGNNSKELLPIDNTININLLNNNTGQNKELGEKKETYGREEINRIMELVTYANGGMIDGSKAKNRQFANHLYKKLQEIPKVMSGDITYDSVLTIMLEVAKDDKFLVSKIASTEKIYHNFSTLVNSTRIKFTKQPKQF